MTGSSSYIICVYCKKMCGIHAGDSFSTTLLFLFLNFACMFTVSSVVGLLITNNNNNNNNNNNSNNNNNNNWFIHHIVWSHNILIKTYIRFDRSTLVIMFHILIILLKR